MELIEKGQKVRIGVGKVRISATGTVATPRASVATVCSYFTAFLPGLRELLMFAWAPGAAVLTAFGALHKKVRIIRGSI